MKNIILISAFFLSLSVSMAQKPYVTEYFYTGKIGQYPIQVRFVEEIRMRGLFYWGELKYTRVGQVVKLKFHQDDSQGYGEDTYFDKVGDRIRAKEFIGQKHTGTLYFDKDYFKRGRLSENPKLEGYWHSHDEQKIYRFELNYTNENLISPGEMGR